MTTTKNESPAFPGPTSEVSATEHFAEEVGTLLTSAELAKIIRVPHATLRYWRHVGVGPRSFKMGDRRVLYPSDTSATDPPALATVN